MYPTLLHWPLPSYYSLPNQPTHFPSQLELVSTQQWFSLAHCIWLALCSVLSCQLPSHRSVPNLPNLLFSSKILQLISKLLALIVVEFAAPKLSYLDQHFLLST
uniref:Uncharacterized protein n=1 Tax=Cacopsylla melanoneura TaxID=428564 RepID=A0A8D8LXI1_9HEMI